MADVKDLVRQIERLKRFVASCEQAREEAERALDPSKIRIRNLESDNLVLRQERASLSKDLVEHRAALAERDRVIVGLQGELEKARRKEEAQCAVPSQPE